MKSKIYTKLEIKYLKKNPFVVDVKCNRFIEYEPIFKLWCVLQRKYYPEKICRELFEYAGFNVNIMNKKLPQARIKSWEDLYIRYGLSYFLDSNNFAMLNNDIFIKSKRDIILQELNRLIEKESKK